MYTLLLPITVLLTGTYLILRLRGSVFLHPIATLRTALHALRRPRAASSLLLALAGTLGVGNIVGVAFGLTVGGAGSVFWMLISAPFAAVLKYGETTLALSCRTGETGGMMGVLTRLFPRHGGVLGTLYATLCLLLAITMGAALQSSAAADALTGAVGWGRPLCALVVTLLSAAVLLGGERRATRATVCIIPATTIVYILLCLAVILPRHEHILPTLQLVLRSAMTPAGIGGGLLGVLTSHAVSEGFARGLLSNEAGAGTSAMAHSRAGAAPVEQGVLGMLEIFFDTVLLCPLTALAVLMSGVPLDGRLGGAALVRAALSVGVGAATPALLALCLFSFALATVLCWYCYGRACLSFLLRGREFPFLPFYLLAVFLGALLPCDGVIPAVDALLLGMTLLTALALKRGTDRIVSLSVPREGRRGEIRAAADERAR